MKLRVTRAVIWAADIEDRPGGLADKLEALARAGTDLEFVVARRAPESPGTGVVFVAPLTTERQRRAATEAGFLKTERLSAVRVEGTNRAGAAGRIAEAVAASEVSLRGFSATALGKRFIGYLAVDNAQEAAKVIRALRQLSK